MLIFDNDPLPSNLLKNPGFEEADFDNPQYAEYWDVLSTHPGDLRVCGPNAYRRACFLRFRTPTVVPDRAIVQYVDTFDQWGVAGDRMTFSAFVQAVNHRGTMRMIVTVVYTDGTSEFRRITLPNGSYGYRPFSVSLTATKPIRTIITTFRANRQTGLIRIDNARLQVIQATPPNAAPLPLPLPDPQ